MEHTPKTNIGMTIFKGDQVVFIKTTLKGSSRYRKSSLSFGSVEKVTPTKLLVVENGSLEKHYVSHDNAYPVE